MGLTMNARNAPPKIPSTIRPKISDASYWPSNMIHTKPTAMTSIESTMKARRPDRQPKPLLVT